MRSVGENGRFASLALMARDAGEDLTFADVVAEGDVIAPGWSLVFLSRCGGSGDRLADDKTIQVALKNLAVAAEAPSAKRDVLVGMPCFDRDENLYAPETGSGTKH